MRIHSLGWQHLPALYRYRKQVICLDSCLALTRGSPLSLAGVATLLNPVQGVYTAVCHNEHGAPPLIGQVRYPMGARTSRLTFLLPDSALNTIMLPTLVDHLTHQAGDWGSFHIMAEVEDRSGAFEGLRRANFSTYTWQRVWRMDAAAAPRSDPKCWGQGREVDTLAVRGLYQSLIPALVQPIEGLAERRLQGLVYKPGEVQAFAEIIYGPAGIWVQPFIHPSMEKVDELVSGLVASIPHPGGRPIYLCVRSYQGWLEPALEELGAEVGPRQALMVKHLAISQRATQLLRRPVLENGRAAEGTAPVVNIHPATVDQEKR